MKNDKLLNRIESELNSKYTDETVTSYMYAIKRFLAQYPNAQRLNLSNIESYFETLKSKSHSVGYRVSNLASIKALYECYIEFGMLKHHPCKSFFISEKKPTGKDFGSLLTLEEMEILLSVKEERFQYLMNRNKVMIGLLIYQGLTSKEMVELKTTHIDLDEGLINIIGQGKNRNRTLQLKPSQVTILLRYIENDRPNLQKSNTDKLLIGMRGNPITTDSLHEFIHRLNGAIDKKVSPMTIRSSVINHWINERKLPLEDVQVMAGHRYPSTTEKYINPTTQEQREAVNMLHQSIFG